VATGQASLPRIGPLRSVIVEVQGIGDRFIVKVIAPDVRGLLASICQYFHEHAVNIETLRARTEAGIAHDTFLVVGQVDSIGLKDHLEQGTLDAGSGTPRLYLLSETG
jgi:UTP:GlnB (protein PII) uridylyltransferase